MSEGGPPRSPDAAWTTRAAWASLALAVGALLWRFVQVGDAAFTFNEATYVDLAAHPWYASYYPDTVFVRHPPVAFLLLAAARLMGDAEWIMRLPALLATLAGIALCWDAARRLDGARSAVLVGLVLAASFPLHAYALKASLYGPVFCAASLAAWAFAARRPRLFAAALVLYALTHLFGFLFLGLYLAWRWRGGERAMTLVGATWPAWSWLLAAVVLGLLNDQGDIMRLGPLGQLLRSGANAGKAVGVRPLVHLTSGAFALMTLGPLLAAAWIGLRRAATATSEDTAAMSWTRPAHRALIWGMLVIALYLPFGAPYPRYALAALPVAVVLGAVHACRAARPWIGPAIAVALLTVPTGFAYVQHGPDPRASGDVPGLLDWEAATPIALRYADVIATSAPTSVAYYLGHAGYQVTDRSEAPYRIGLLGEHAATVVRLDAPDDPAGLEADAQAYVIPTAWGRPPTDKDMTRVGQVHGVTVWAAVDAALAT